MCSCSLRSFSRWWPLAFLIFSPQTKFSCCFPIKKCSLSLSLALCDSFSRWASIRWPAAYFLFFPVFLFLYIPKILAKILMVLRKNLRGSLFKSLCVYFEDLCRNFHEDLCKILKDLGKIIEDPNRLYWLKNSSVQKFARSPSKFLNGRIWNGPV